MNVYEAVLNSRKEAELGVREMRVSSGLCLLPAVWCWADFLMSLTALSAHIKWKWYNSHVNI